MEPIITICTYTELTEKQKMEMHRLRYDVFIERLQWSIETQGQLDIDEYDRPDSKYIIIEYGNKVAACWRLLQTNGVYMLNNTFPDLLQGEVFNDKSIVELTRFAVDREIAKQASHINFTSMLFYLVVQYAIEQGYSEYVTLTSTGIERIMRKIGIPSCRIGDGKVHLLDTTRSVALRVPVDDALRYWFANTTINQHRFDRAS
ncbi:acyl-homoserine-lactone synthase [Vibrio methylphosphonaticus]|uniref:acyl-homoserine-lactone synthase n=1 Tax=Vibrio methylphosphonaticus TaxID=2946866 RepID=UPI002029F50F|nr:acyl-homoserine-lactone synthase [Vibrio methylphosphonaticus]MCL9773843.1 GNAT family N-acetyltransferase [Vibrio methylphosphonaticus]